ncbi:hypothetical protein GCM10009623_05530 [Nocardioides aestuarii]|uniref:MarR family winged helix-turn-helix transcriptional regulator n=1 Tax=Nocardioides aestuarii TaxID=252231 RepID=A0ABW4THT9_9ACTN
MSSEQLGGAEQQAATEALMATSRLLTGVIARTLSDIEVSVTVPQLRVLVMLQLNAPLNLGAIADGLGVNPSNASRTCDRLVAAGLVTRVDDVRDRRQVSLSMTPEGESLVTSLMHRRRELLDDVVGRMAPADQRRLAQGLAALLAVLDDEEWARVGSRPGAILPWIR